MGEAEESLADSLIGMNWNLLDLLALAWIGFGVWRGGRRGFPSELPKVVGVMLALIAGGGLFRLTEQLLTDATRTAGIRSGPVSFITVLVAAFVIVRHFKRRMRDWAQQTVPEKDRQRRYGMWSGGLRAFGLCALVVLLSSLIPIGEFRKPFTRGSMFGRVVVKTIRPVYRAAQATEKPAPAPSP